MPTVGAKIIEADFSQKCGGCGGEIEEGDRITVIDGEWVCWTTCGVEEYGEEEDV